MRRESRGDAAHRPLPGLRMASVKSAHPDRDGNVVGRLSWLEREAFRLSLAQAEEPRLDFRGAQVARHGNCFARPVNPEYMSIADTPGHFPCEGARSAADFQYAHARSQRQRVRDSHKPC